MGPLTKKLVFNRTIQYSELLELNNLDQAKTNDL